MNKKLIIREANLSNVNSIERCVDAAYNHYISRIGKGIGKHLMNFAESEAKDQGFEKIDLYTHECMNENVKIYKALGYIETGRKEEKGYNRVYMQKSLS